MICYLLTCDRMQFQFRVNQFKDALFKGSKVPISVFLILQIWGHHPQVKQPKSLLDHIIVDFARMSVT
jgi:hypothetical protein